MILLLWVDFRVFWFFSFNIKIQVGNFLVVQWLGLCASTVGGMGLIPDQLLVGELRSCMLGGLAKKGKGKMDFFGGPVVKNPPANAGNMGSIPSPGGFHMQQGN